MRRRGWRVRSFRLRWTSRGTSMLPWVSAVALLVATIAVADFDYRSLIPVIPLASLAAGLAFARRRRNAVPGDSAPATSPAVASEVPDAVS